MRVLLCALLLIEDDIFYLNNYNSEQLFSLKQCGFWVDGGKQLPLICPECYQHKIQLENDKEYRRCVEIGIVYYDAKYELPVGILRPERIKQCMISAIEEAFNQKINPCRTKEERF